jgi:PAS domain S-box-containing protein
VQDESHAAMTELTLSASSGILAMSESQSILVVDDQVENLKVIFNALRPNYSVRVAKSGPEALSLLGQVRPPDLFLLDIMMPEMDGYALCQQLKSMPGHVDTPVIFLTAKSQPEDEERGFELGAVDYVTKPANPRLLHARIKAHLALAQQRQRMRLALDASHRMVARVSRERDTWLEPHAGEMAGREQAEAALRESQARFARLTTELADRLFFFTSATDGEMLYLSEGYRRLVGCHPEDAHGLHWRDLAEWAPESLAKVLGASERWLNDGREKARFELSFRHPEGKWRQLEVHAYRIFDQERELELIEGIALDVTEQRSMDARLRTLAAAVEHAPVSITVTDAQGQILYVNPHFSKLSGYAREDVIGHNPRLLKSGEQDADFYERMWTTLKRGETWRGELVNKSKDGQLYWVATAIAPVRDAQGTLLNYVAVKEDISDRRELDRIKEDVERIMRHDLKTPLNLVINLPELLLLDDALSHEQRENVEMIRDAGKRMLEMIDLSLDLFKMETGQYANVPCRVDLLRILRDLLASMRQRIAEKRLRILLKVDGEALPAATLFDPAAPAVVASLPARSLMIAADARLLFSMLGNLLTNAVDASPGGGEIRVEIQRQECVLLDLCNQGAVPEAIREHFFEKYRTCGKQGGTGLGTYSAKLMADTMGFDLSMTTSDADNRTCIALRMPPIQ